MITSAEEKALRDYAGSEVATGMLAELARVKADHEKVVEVRNRFINGAASREQVFLALNSAATNLLIFRELREKHIRMLLALKRSDDMIGKKRQGSALLPDEAAGCRKATVIAFPAGARTRDGVAAVSG